MQDNNHWQLYPVTTFVETRQDDPASTLFNGYGLAGYISVCNKRISSIAQLLLATAETQGKQAMTRVGCWGTCDFHLISVLNRIRGQLSQLNVPSKYHTLRACPGEWRAWPRVSKRDPLASRSWTSSFPCRRITQSERCCGLLRWLAPEGRH